MAWVLKGEDGKLVLGGAWGPWSLEGRGFGGLESGALGPGGAPGEAAGSGSLEGGCLAWALEGSRFDKLEGEELGPGGALGPESLEGDGVAWSLEGDVRPWRRGSEVHAGWRFCREVGVKGPGGAWPREGGEIVTLEGGKLVPGEDAGPVSLEGK